MGIRNRGVQGFVLRMLLAGCTMTILMACSVPRPTIKIALVAPFEGRFREVGYDAFPAMRLALREQFKAGGIGNYEVEFVAYNDNADSAFAERVAHNVILDDRVVAVIGHLRLEPTLAALHVYTEARLSLVVPDIPSDRLPVDPLVFRLAPTSSSLSSALSRCQNHSELNDTSFTQPYQGSVQPDVLARLPAFTSPAAPNLLGQAIDGLCFATAAPYPRDLPGAAQALSGFPAVSGGFPAGPGSISAYDATRLILQAIRVDVEVNGAATRAGVTAALTHIHMTGLRGPISFDAQNDWVQAPVWIYQFDTAGEAHLLQ
jgi:ABC-type branched-subunit amino acid transport system substrate-binding protein